MESFSQRKGIKPIKSLIQVDSMDEALRNGLWNAITIYYWDRVRPLSHVNEYYLSSNEQVEILVRRIWMYHFKKQIDTLGNEWFGVLKQIRNHFFTCQWNEVYDFVEFVANNYPDKYMNEKYITYCNTILKQEISGYRFVGGIITPITSEEEIAEVEEVFNKVPNPVSIHLKTALNLLSDRKSPNYRNSIKESISAVESICKIISGNPKAELEQALREIEKQTELHPALKKSFSSLYGYTSDAEGIRHALLEEPNLDVEDAKFMLICCSAFINYLRIKASKANIKL